MREILFRGKRIDTGEWVEGYYYKAKFYRTDTDLCDYITIPHPEQEGRASDHFMIIPTTISEFTGLCDKNGKKIFEGDIFRPFDNEIIVVAWIDYYSTLGFLCRIEHTETKRGKEITESHDGWAMLCDYELSELEVIGNIHDNPELLKEVSE